MTNTLSSEDKLALIKYRMERSYNALKEAQIMAREGYYNASINRLYYACYYAAVALLLTNDIPTQTHNGVKTMLGQHFIATGLLPISAGKTFAVLFNQRHSGDYDDFVYCDQEMFETFYPQAENFVNSVSELLEKMPFEHKDN